MASNFTQDDLIRLHYKETSVEESEAIERALKTDAKLKMEQERLALTLRRLDSISLGPSQSSLDIIMSYAKDQHPELQ